MTCTGGPLGYSELHRRLTAGEIFRQGTWHADNIRAAAYDLRMADDFMIVPDKDFPNGRRYDRGTRRTDPVILRPGDVAFCSTRERIAIPWDLSGNIGIKFGFPRRGVLVLTGLLVDPGFGMEKSSGNDWYPKADERLHFLLANVGANDVVLRPGEDKIASLQLFPVTGNVRQAEVQSTSDIQREFFASDTHLKVGLWFFNEMAEVREIVSKYEQRINAVHEGANQVVLFGVWLIAASLLVSAIGLVLSAIGSEAVAQGAASVMNAVPSSPLRCVTIITASLAIIVLLGMCSRMLGSIAIWVIGRIFPKK